jgi:guanylate kinase
MDNTLPTLHNKQAFQDALLHYEASEHAKKVLASTPFVALSGLAGGGRNTVINYLVERYNYIFAISDTTRPPKIRDGKLEQDGVNYYFRNEEDISGTSIREIQRLIKTGKIPIHDFEYGGVNNVQKTKPDATIIGLIPPSYDEWIRRLRGREVMHDQEFHNRLITAEKVLENMLAYDHFKIVVNDTIEQCIQDIRQIVERDLYTEETHVYVSSVARELLASVRDALNAAELTQNS